MTSSAWLLGVHIATVHVGDLPPWIEPVSFTPGVYIVTPSGLTAGVFRNSIQRPSAYLGYSWRSGPWALTLAGATGYRFGPVTPMLGISYRFGASSGARVALLPERAVPVALSLEFSR